MRGRADDAGPDEPIIDPSELVEKVLGALEEAGAPREVNDEVVKLIEKWEASLIPPEQPEEPGPLNGWAGLDLTAPKNWHLTGGPAFPRPMSGPVNGIALAGTDGMSLRDYFAAHASQDDLQNYVRIENPEGVMKGYRTREAAKYAYADAMLKAREQKDN